MKTNIKIVMADDHPIVRQGLGKIIESDPQISIIAESGDGEKALDLILEHRPAVAVLDLDMPKIDGFTVIRELRKRKAEVEIVILTIHSEEDLFQSAMDLGVKGYVLKDSVVSDIVAAIKSVAAHRPFLSPVGAAAEPAAARRRAGA